MHTCMYLCMYGSTTSGAASDTGSDSCRSCISSSRGAVSSGASHCGGGRGCPVYTRGRGGQVAEEEQYLEPEGCCLERRIPLRREEQFRVCRAFWVCRGRGLLRQGGVLCVAGREDIIPSCVTRGLLSRAAHLTLARRARRVRYGGAPRNGGPHDPLAHAPLPPLAHAFIQGA